MLLFDEKAFGGDSRGWAVALHELHTEVNDLKASLARSLERESAWQRSCGLLEAQLRRRR